MQRLATLFEKHPRQCVADSVGHPINQQGFAWKPRMELQRELHFKRLNDLRCDMV